MTSATNPESGTVTVDVYDNNGNVVSRVLMNNQLPGFGSYGTNNRQARAIVILHELAHLIRKADGSDWLIKDDRTSPDQRDSQRRRSKKNTETAQKACKEQLDAVEYCGGHVGAFAVGL